MSIETQLVEVAENVPKVYNAGYEKGKVDEYDTFWNNYQNSGTQTDYRYAFGGYGWDSKTFKPKYSLSDIKITNAIGMFQNTKITTVNYDLDLSSITASSSANYAFANTSIKTIKSLILPKANNTTLFTGSKKLTSIRINGTTEYTFSLADCPLDEDSLMSVIGSLSTTATGKTCTLNKTAVNTAFTDEEWKALTDAKDNWTFTLK